MSRNVSFPLATALILGLGGACANPEGSGAGGTLISNEPWIESVPGEWAPLPSDRSMRDRLSPAHEDPDRWTLDAVLRQIVRANPTIVEASATLEEAKAAEREAVLAFLPEFSFGVDYLSTNNPAQAFALLLNQERLTLGPSFDPTPGSIDNWRTEVRFDYLLYAPGRDAAFDTAVEGAQAARLALEAMERRVLNAGVQAWLGLRAVRELEAVSRESITVVQQRLEQTRKRHQEGAALRADVLRLEVRLAFTRQEAARATLAVRKAESFLNHLLSRSPQSPLRLSDEEVVIGASLPDQLDLLLEQAQTERRDVLALTHRVRMAQSQSEASRAQKLPVVQVFGSYGIDSPDLALDGGLDSYVAGIGLRIPFSARTGARIFQMEARERRAQEQLRELLLAVAQEVSDAWEEVAVAEEILVLAEASVGASEEAFRIVAQAQDAGGATVTDVLEAEDARKTARARHVAARAGVQIARAKLVAAKGGVR